MAQSTPTAAPRAAEPAAKPGVKDLGKLSGMELIDELLSLERRTSKIMHDELFRECCRKQRVITAELMRRLSQARLAEITTLLYIEEPVEQILAELEALAAHIRAAGRHWVNHLAVVLYWDTDVRAIIRVNGISRQLLRFETPNGLNAGRHVSLIVLRLANYLRSSALRGERPAFSVVGIANSKDRDSATITLKPIGV